MAHILWVMRPEEALSLVDCVSALEGRGMNVVVVVSDVEEAKDRLMKEWGFDLVIWELEGAPREGECLGWLASGKHYPQQAFYDWMKAQGTMLIGVRTLLFTRHREVVYAFCEETQVGVYPHYAIARRDYSPDAFRDRVMQLMTAV